MLRSKYLSILLSTLILLSSCRSTRPTVVPAAEEASAGAYIERYKNLAISEMRRTGIPASITLAQGMIESDFGRSSLAREANNHFGIKCHNDWTGPAITHHDERRNECFRKYRRPEESYYDHSDFLRTGSRYTSLFDLSPTDYKGWARGLKKAGYATNPDYANMLIRKIEENNLYYFDSGYTAIQKPGVTPGQPNNDTIDPVIQNQVYDRPISNGNFAVTAVAPRIMENNRIQFIVVKDGESKEKIENEFQLLNWELAKYNELKSDFIPVAGQMLYLQPKRDKAESGNETHSAIEGDTLYAISQKYGVKLKKLYEYNRMTEGNEPVAGQEIWLRTMKPVN
jgi:LysM repeat protein